ncbi:hypothetical protein SCLCIDRAFT_25037 [Scleroderma citrinum Foug A]|uniref:Uncharacterized protein n=1 Tax=Scleroderma citrinum Foug A TaxID=1036808 RepID=A0A0C3ABI8_9AGAM|nr:hypothetical protein SCLCIDRAFT_25037 [Scleroderma citrinum Foug A]
MFGGEGARDERFAPFNSETDWHVAEWAVKSKVGHKQLDRLLAVPGLVDKAGLSYINTWGLLRFIEDIPAQAEWESVALSFKDAPEDKYVAIKTLLGDPSLAKDIVYKPKCIFTNANKDKRVYNEMWMGTWWEETQAKLPEGSCAVAVIIATDKTQLTQFSGGQQGYPVYLTLGNIPRAIRRKPSKKACMLIAVMHQTCLVQ